MRPPPVPRILWIGAHPDDESLLAPLLGWECVERPASCSMLVMTRGERGDCVLPGGCGDLGALRAAEMQRAADALHAQLTLWTFSDVMTGVDAAWSGEAGGRDALLDRIAAAIVAVRPTVIYTFDPAHGSTCHPAHRAVGRLVIEALGRVAAPPPLVLVETAEAFEGDGFSFRSAVAQPMVVDAIDRWSYLVRNAELHASQFPPAAVQSLRNIPSEQRRVFLLAAPDAAHAEYALTCP